MLSVLLNVSSKALNNYKVVAS